MRAQKLLKRRNGERFWEIVNYLAALIYDPLKVREVIRLPS